MNKAVRDNAVDWLKWIAIITMIIDHLRYLPASPPWVVYIGRIAFPTFAILCGWNSMKNSKHQIRFAVRVTILAISLQILQILIQDPRLSQLNPIITLAAGLWFLVLLLHIKPNALSALIISISAATLICVDKYIAYGISGIGIIVIGALATKLDTTNKYQVSIMYITLVLMATHINNTTNLAINTITCLAAVFSVMLLIKTTTRPCPLPNSKWLYLAFPASLIPAAIASMIRNSY